MPSNVERMTPAHLLHWVIAKRQGRFPMHHDQVPMDTRSIEGIENLPCKLRPCPGRPVEPGLFVRV